MWQDLQTRTYYVSKKKVFIDVIDTASKLLIENNRTTVNKMLALST